MEAALLGLFMVSACVCTALVAYPAWPIARVVPDPARQRLLIGLLMGSTAIALIYCPWGRRSGAHFNPAVTLTFLRLGRIAPADAAWYAIFQLAGGIAGVLASKLILGGVIASAQVNYAVTVPGPSGAGAALAGELAIAFITMIVVLTTSNRPRLAPYTGWIVGGLVFAYVVFESPLSGFGMNPARTLASAIPGGRWDAIWIYLFAPPLAMLAAAEVYLAVQRAHPVMCAKLRHDSVSRCIFRCGYCTHTTDAAAEAGTSPAAGAY